MSNYSFIQFPYSVINRLDPTPLFIHLEYLRKQIELGNSPDRMKDLINEYGDFKIICELFKESKRFHICGTGCKWCKEVI